MSSYPNGVMSSSQRTNLQGRPNGIERHHFTNPTRGKLTLAALGARADEHINVLETLVQENTNHAERILYRGNTVREKLLEVPFPFPFHWMQIRCTCVMMEKLQKLASGEKI